MVELCLEYGPTTFQRGNPRLVRNETDLDELTVEWQTPRQTSFSTGGQPPNYSGMRIMRVTVTEEVPGRAYIHELSCVGFVGNKPQKRTARSIGEKLEGFDEASEEYLTRNPEGHGHGDGLDDYGQMWCTDVDKMELRAGFWKVRKGYKGIIGSKPYKRTISVNEQIVSTSDPIENELSGGWTGAQIGSLSLPRIVVTDSYVSTTAPPTDAIPGNSTPADAPPLNDDIGFTDIPLTYNWPAGWKLASLSSEQIPGKSVWLITLAREFVYEAVPR